MLSGEIESAQDSTTTPEPTTVVARTGQEQILLPGLTMTIPLTAISFAFALVIAVVTALVQYANIRVLGHVARFYIWLIRGTPVLVQLYVVFYGLPSLGIRIDPFPAAVLVFSINEGAYAAEIMRAALESVPKDSWSPAAPGSSLNIPRRSEPKPFCGQSITRWLVD